MVITHGAEPDETSMGLYAEWLQMFPPKPSRPSDIYSMPESAAASPEEDCAFEYTDGQSCVEEHQDTMEEDHQEQTEAEDQTADTLGVAYDGNGTIPGDMLRDPRLMSKVFTDLDSRVRGVEEQFLEQNAWNGNMQQNMENMAHGYDEIQNLKKTIATLQEKVAALSLARNGTVERRPGRPKRPTQ
ncbi:hypothetical protein PMG11_11177 [Penicillium brasilianum]|uniref:Uncharacterized protein n=1 Tax=Penicillium brasilianum TaxID=104259 RepID=A0A0F7U135_PENBI|nr:hypothetical protein PMG11_11177 [Penicillium brasilianum]